MKEIWKDINGYEHLYQISNFGRVKSLERKVYWGCNYKTCRNEKERLLNYIKDKNGYLRCSLHKDGKQRNYSVHRLVAETFIPNLEGKPEVNHIDGNKKNNRVTNLEWVTSQENQIHAFKMGLQKIRRGKDSSSAKAIIQYDYNGNLIKEHASISDALKFIGKKPHSRLYIRKSCIGENRTAYGYVWRYKEGKVLKHIDISIDPTSIPSQIVKPVLQCDLDGNFIREFGSSREVARYLDKPYARRDIMKCCQGKNKTAYGYIWKYK